MGTRRATRKSLAEKALSIEIRLGFSLFTWKLKSPAVRATDLVEGSLLTSWVYLLQAAMTLLLVS